MLLGNIRKIFGGEGGRIFRRKKLLGREQYLGESSRRNITIRVGMGISWHDLKNGQKVNRNKASFFSWKQEETLKLKTNRNYSVYEGGCCPSSTLNLDFCSYFFEKTTENKATLILNKKIFFFFFLFIYFFFFFFFKGLSLKIIRSVN